MGLRFAAKNKRPGRMTSSSPPCCLLARLFECVRLHSKSYLYGCVHECLSTEQTPAKCLEEFPPTARKSGGSVSNFTNERRPELEQTHRHTHDIINSFSHEI